VQFCDLNGYELHVPFNDAVSTMLSVAAGQFPEVELAEWIRGLAKPMENS